MKGIPVWVSWIKYVSIIYWGWNLLLKIEFSNRSYPCADIITDSPGIQVGVLVEGYRVGVLVEALSHMMGGRGSSRQGMEGL